MQWDSLRVSVGQTVTAGTTIGAEGNTGKSFGRSEEHTSELQSLMRISYAVFCLKKTKLPQIPHTHPPQPHLHPHPPPTTPPTPTHPHTHPHTHHPHTQT